MDPPKKSLVDHFLLLEASSSVSMEPDVVSPPHVPVSVESLASAMWASFLSLLDEDPNSAAGPSQHGVGVGYSVLRLSRPRGAAHLETWHIRAHADDPCTSGSKGAHEDGGLATLCGDSSPSTPHSLFWRAGFDRPLAYDKWLKAIQANRVPSLVCAALAVIRAMMRKNIQVTFQGKQVTQVHARLAYVRAREHGVSDPALARRGVPSEALLWCLDEDDDERTPWDDALIPHAWLVLNLEGATKQIAVDVACAALDNADADDESAGEGGGGSPKPFASAPGTFFDGATACDVRTAARLRREFENMRVAQRVGGARRRPKSFSLDDVERIAQGVTKRLGVDAVDWLEEEESAKRDEEQARAKEEVEQERASAARAAKAAKAAKEREREAMVARQAMEKAESKMASSAPAPAPAHQNNQPSSHHVSTAPAPHHDGNPSSPPPQATTPLTREERVKLALKKKRGGL